MTRGNTHEVPPTPNKYRVIHDRVRRKGTLDEGKRVATYTFNPTYGCWLYKLDEPNAEWVLEGDLELAPTDEGVEGRT